MVFGERFVEAEVEFHAGAAELVGDELLHVEAGVVDAVFFEVGGAFFEDFEDGGHGVRVQKAGQGIQPFA